MGIILFYCLVALLVILLVVIKSIENKKPSHSLFELKRRSALGDEEAGKQLIYLNSAAKLSGLLRLKEVAIVIGLSLVIGSIYGGWSLLITIILWLFCSLLSMAGWVRRPINHYFDQYRDKVIAIIMPATWLKHFSGFPEIKIPVIASRSELLYRARISKLLSRQEYSSLETLLAQDHMKAQNIMINIASVDKVNETEPLGPLTLDMLHKTDHQVFPVINDDESIIGILNLGTDIDLHMAKKRAVDCMTKDFEVVPADMPVRDVLAVLVGSHQPLVVVVDGQSVAGVVFLRDAVEAMTGKLTRVSSR